MSSIIPPIKLTPGASFASKATKNVAERMKSMAGKWNTAAEEAVEVIKKESSLPDSSSPLPPASDPQKEVPKKPNTPGTPSTTEVVTTGNISSSDTDFAKIKFYSSHAINIDDTEDNIGKISHNPFYYDHELEDIQYSARLYPSTGWVEGDTVAGWFPLHKSITRNTSALPNASEDKVFYSKIPLIQSIYSEDFNVSAANDWNDANFGTDLQDAMNRGKVFVPYFHKISQWTKIASGAGNEHLDELEKKQREKANAGGDGAESAGYSLAAINTMRFANNTLGRLSGLLDDAVANLDKTSIIQGTRFSYYSGTGISFGNLVMRFTLFSDFKYVSEYNENAGKYVCSETTRFVPVTEQLNQLYDYSIGKYLRWLDVYNKSESDATNGSVKVGAIKPKGVRNANSGVGTDSYLKSKYGDEKGNIDYSKSKGDDEWLDKDLINSFLNTFMGWQIAPGGYRPKPEDIDSLMIGTFRLEIGTHYVIENLVIQDIQFNYSRQMAKFPVGNSQNAKELYAPLYCDVQITLRPATKYTDDALRSFTNNKPSGFIDRVNKSLYNSTEGGYTGMHTALNTVSKENVLDVYMNKTNNLYPEKDH